MSRLRRLAGSARAIKAEYDRVNAIGKAQQRMVGQAVYGPAGEAAMSGRKPPRQPAIEDPEQRELVAAQERRARTVARAPYLPPDPPVVERMRFATGERSQAAEVGAQLARAGLTARPDLVYGVYRVPDGGVVEWEVVHAARAPLPPADEPVDVVFDARERYVNRRVGEPRPSDEDVALGYLAGAGIGPEGTLGIARHVEERSHEVDGNRQQLAMVTGVHVFHPHPARRAASGPPPPDVRSDRLNWDGVARAVAPVRRDPEPVPSPWPYLPLTAGELLSSYLEVVGIAPSDSFGVQVTYDRAFDLMSRSHRSGHVRVHRSGRVLGGSQVIVTYRDRPEYAEGRKRWVRYQATVLQADLQFGLSGGEPVPKPDSRLMKVLDRAYDIASVFDWDQMGGDDFVERPRYCWPPVD